MCLSLETLTSKDWLTYSGGSDGPGKLCYNFSFSNNLTQMVNFPIRIAECNSHADWMVVMVFKLGASVAASEFCEWVQAGIDVYNYTSS